MESASFPTSSFLRSYLWVMEFTLIANHRGGVLDHFIWGGRDVVESTVFHYIEAETRQRLREN
jgi:hypothetical protein